MSLSSGAVQSVTGGVILPDDRATISTMLTFAGGQSGFGTMGISPGCTVGAARLRRDGFAPIVAHGATEGTLLSKPLSWSEDRTHLFLNCAGSLTVEILRVGQVVRRSLEVNGNSTRLEVPWAVPHSGEALPHAPFARPLQLRFTLQPGAALYSFWPATSKCGASEGIVAGGGPGFESSRDKHGACKTDDDTRHHSWVPFADFGVPAEGAYGLAAFRVDARSRHNFLAVSDFFGHSSSIWSNNQPNKYSLNQTLPSNAGHSWATINMGDEQGIITHLFLCNYRTWPASGPCVSRSRDKVKEHTGCPPITPTNSTLWRWDASHGKFTLVQKILTHGTNAAAAFMIDGVHYLAVANAHRNISDSVAEGTVNSTVYNWDTASGQFVPMQSILTHSALDVKHWKIGSDHYLGFANSPIFSPEQWSPVFKWSGGSFVSYQNLTGTSGATGLEPFSIGGDSYLAVANRLCPRTGHLCYSTIYRWQSFNEGKPLWQHHQTIQSHGAYDWEFFCLLSGQCYLALANHIDKNANKAFPCDVDSVIYAFNASTKMFQISQQLPTNGAEQIRHFQAICSGQNSNNTCDFLAITQFPNDTNSPDGSDVPARQPLPTSTKPNASSKVWVYRSHDSVVNTASSGSATGSQASLGKQDRYPAPPAQLLSSTGKFVPLQLFGVPRTGGYGLESFNIGDSHYLALANFFGNDSVIYTWNGTRFVHFQTLPSHAGHAFRHFQVNGDDYLALANYRTGFAPGDPNGWPAGAWFVPPRQTNSSLWKWSSSEGQFVEFQSLETSFANAWTAFSIGGRSYIAVANSHSRNGSTGKTNSTVYEYSSASGRGRAAFEPVQSIVTYSALDVESFQIDGDTFLAFANSQSASEGFLVNSSIYKWSDTQARFVLWQLLATSAATGITFFTVSADHQLLAIANRYGKTGHRENSVIFRWQKQQQRFEVFQSIPTQGAYDWESFEIAGVHFLAVCNHWDDSAPDKKHPIAIDSEVFRWDNASDRFVGYQSIPTIGAEQIRHFVVPMSGAGSTHMLAVAQCVDDASGWNTTSQILSWVPDTHPVQMKTDDRSVGLRPDDEVRIFVADAVHGHDDAAGTVAAPFQSLGRCVAALSMPGDECRLRTGRYHSWDGAAEQAKVERPVAVTGLHGTSDAPIVLASFPGEHAVIDGTEHVPGPFRQWKGNIYRAKAPHPIWQAWREDAMLVNARWPNARWSDFSVFNGIDNFAISAPNSTISQMTDASPCVGCGTPGAHGKCDPSWGLVCPASPGSQGPSIGLAASGVDAKGAMTVLNIASWYSFVARVQQHTAGSSTFTYNATPFGSPSRGKFNPSNLETPNRYFLEDKLSLLDQPEEWFYEAESSYVYVWAPASGHVPSVRGKVQSYALNITNSSHLLLSNLTFFGTTLWASTLSPQNRIGPMRFESLNFSYPSYSKRMLRSTSCPEYTVVSSTGMDPTAGYSRRACTLKECGVAFQFFNCSFVFADGPSLHHDGVNSLFLNNEWVRNDWSNAAATSFSHGKSTTIASNGEGDIWLRNSLHHNGSPHGLQPAPGSLVADNHFSFQCAGSIAWDGCAVQVSSGRQCGTVLRGNWAHDMPKFGLRYMNDTAISIRDQSDSDQSD
eukprot:SAG25_NODE_181_length_12544_cov_32.416472_2_plen_1608_part_00